MVGDKMTQVTITPAKLKEIAQSVDWQRVREMTDEDVGRQNAADSNAVTLTTAEALAIRVQYVRKQAGLTQNEFSARFRIPLGTLRDWEQARREPDAAALAYLQVIEHDPQAVLQALEPDAA